MAAKPVMVRVAFFKGKGSLADRLLRLLGFGPYTRVEVVVGRRLKTGWHCYAPRESGPMRQLIDLKPEDWDIVDVRGVSRASALRWYKQREERPCRLRDLGSVCSAARRAAGRPSLSPSLLALALAGLLGLKRRKRPRA